MAVVSIQKDYFHVGERATSSGVYRAIHDGHRSGHSVLVIAGDEFPPCRFCNGRATFVLVEKAAYIAHDLDFAGLPLKNIR